MEQIKISKKQACQFILLHQGLGSSFELKGKQGVMEYIKRVGCIQFDTLDVIGRNPDLVLQSRVKGYQKDMLQQLLYQERRLLDQWDKEMSIYPVEDWPCFRRNREASFKTLGREDKAIMEFLPQIRKAIEEKGPVSSGDLDFNQVVDWWWAPTRLSRAALESMYHWGELIVQNKAGTRKYYDFTCKCLPRELIEKEDPNRSWEEYYDWHVLRRIGAVGLMWNKAGDAWLGIKGLKATERNEAFRRLLEQEKIIEIEVADMKYPLYMRKQDKDKLYKVLEGKYKKSRAAFIAPLDNMLWDRKLIQELFGFEYRWEVYKPEAQRQYGYYVLPILYGDEFIGRFEPVVDKKSKVLHIKGWWWEAGVKVTAKMQRDLKQCLNTFMEFAEAREIRINDEIMEKNHLQFLISEESTK